MTTHWVVTDPDCEPAWPEPRRPGIDTLPDISHYQEATMARPYGYRPSATTKPGTPPIGPAGASHPATATIPRETFQQLVAIARHVSLGRAAVDLTPYPDALARRTLGALDDAGLLDTQEQQ